MNILAWTFLAELVDRRESAPAVRGRGLSGYHDIIIILTLCKTVDLIVRLYNMVSWTKYRRSTLDRLGEGNVVREKVRASSGL